MRVFFINSFIFNNLRVVIEINLLRRRIKLKKIKLIIFIIRRIKFIEIIIYCVIKIIVKAIIKVIIIIITRIIIIIIDELLTIEIIKINVTFKLFGVTNIIIVKFNITNIIIKINITNIFIIFNINIIIIINIIIALKLIILIKIIKFINKK